LIFQTAINNLGYGVAGYNIFKEIIKKEPKSALYPISKPEFIDEYIESGMRNRHLYNIFSSDAFRNATSVKMWHQNDIHSHIGKGKHIGFPIFELTTFSKEEKISIQQCDELFVCSEWAKDVMLDNVGIKRDVQVVPLGVDTELFQPCVGGRDTTVFFNCGKWEKRKGHDVLLECFNRAFQDRDNVELWMMCDNPFIGEDNNKWKQLYKNSPLGHKIRIIPRQHSHKDVYNIMKQTDCGVFPARAEGWNLELLEMMACGKDVIATNYSAHTEFCNKDNCYLVEIEELEKAYDGVFFSGEYGEWANFSNSTKDQLIEHMRNVHGVKQGYTKSWESGMRDLCINHKGVETAKKFTWKNSAERLLNGL
jgi:glycosyltransferase involved in cell wall biosynthesis